MLEVESQYTSYSWLEEKFVKGRVLYELATNREAGDKIAEERFYGAESMGGVHYKFDNKNNVMLGHELNLAKIQ